jgi:pimeloyl-ACP methyl ester carboxylesterase
MSGEEPFIKTAVVDEIRTVYYERGSGRALVLLHGMFGDYTDWETVLEQLSQNFRLIAPDLPGFGASGKPDVPYDSEFFVSWMHKFLSTVGVSKPVFVGNSFGGELAILYALAHPENVTGLVLASSGGMKFFSEADQALLREKFSIENLKALTPTAHEWIFRPIFAEQGEAWRRYLAKQNAKLERSDREEYARALHRSMLLAYTLYFDGKLRHLKIPVLLVWGDGDVVFPVELAQQALAKLPNGELVLLERAGHAPQLENPEGFVRAVERFVERFGSTDARGKYGSPDKHPIL